MNKALVMFAVFMILMLGYTIFEYIMLKNEKDSLAKQLNERDAAIGVMSEAIRELTDIKVDAPKDCNLGAWCQGCVYVKKYYKYLGVRYGAAETQYCGKSGSCENFIQRENR